MKKIKIKNERLVFSILIIISFILLILYYNFIFSAVFARTSFANQMVEISNQNENTIFSIQKILLYSSANARDNSEDQSLKNVSIDQFSDLSIYIDNTNSNSELTDENTIKELYIDKINVSTNSDIGTKNVNYKSPLDFGKYKKIQNAENNRIDFNIINTNQANENNDYTKPTFYTDCSNPITLGYLNKDILTNYAVSADSNTISFNGKVLKEANVNLDDINYVLSFAIHITNNLNQKFIYNMSVNVDLNDNNGGIYNGYSYKVKTATGDQYRFFKEV